MNGKRINFESVDFDKRGNRALTMIVSVVFYITVALSVVSSLSLFYFNRSEYKSNFQLVVQREINFQNNIVDVNAWPTDDIVILYNYATLLTEWVPIGLWILCSIMFLLLIINNKRFDLVNILKLVFYIGISVYIYLITGVDEFGFQNHHFILNNIPVLAAVFLILDSIHNYSIIKKYK